MKNIAFGLSLCFIVMLRMANAQVSVYIDNTHLLNLGTTELNNPIPSEANMIEVGTSGTTSFNTNTNKEVTACTQIHLVPNTHLIAPTTATNQLHLSVVDNKLDIYSYTHSNLSQVHALEKFETGIELPQDIKDRIQAHKLNDQDTNGLNPFLEWEVAVKVNYTHVATGYTHFNYGFYYEEHSRYTPGYPNSGHFNWGWKMTDSTEEFRVRYAFPELNGLWKVEYELYVDSTLYYSYCPFNVTVIDKIPGDGFVEVADNNRMLVRDGDLFLPIGHNLTWPDGYTRPNGQGVPCEYDTSGEPCESAAFFDFDTRMENYSAAGMDFYRLILSPGSIDIEFEKMGNYFDRMNYAWEIDNIIEYAESKDMYIDFNMKVHYGLVDGPVYALFAWDGSDYTAYGFDTTYAKQQLCYVEELDMESPSEFLTNETAKEYYKQKLRYMYSRWGYSQNIALFELISEINQVGAVEEVDYHFPSDIAPADTGGWWQYAYTYASYYPYASSLEHRHNTYLWQKEMAEYIKNDLRHNQHILTCSYAGFPTEMFDDVANQYGDLSFSIPELDIISYNDYSFGDLDFMEMFQQRVKYCHDNFDKPVLISEMGTNAEWCTDTRKDYTKQLWSNVFMGSCGFMFWTYRTGEFAPDWQEMIRMKEWILNDPEITAILLGDWKVGHAHGTERGTFGQEYWRKDFNYIQSLSTPYKAFGALVNLTDNFYTNLTLSDTWCDDLTGNPWLSDISVYEDTIPDSNRLLVRNDLFLNNDPIFNPWNNILWSSTTQWYDFDSFNPISGFETTSSVMSGGGVLQHPPLYVTADSVAEYGFRGIIPFISAMNFSSGLTTSTTNIGEDEQSPVQFAATVLNGELSVFDISSPMSEVRNDKETLVSEQYHIIITNPMGQEVYQNTLNTNDLRHINSLQLPTGMLIITLYNNSEKHTIRCLNL